MTNLRDRRLDNSPAADYWDMAASALGAQIDYLHDHKVAYWCQRLDNARLHRGRFSTEAWLALPPMTKENLRSLPPWELVPSINRKAITHCFGTSGTTGVPTFAMWSSDDWLAFTETIARGLGHHKPVSEIVALNGYHQAHTAGAAYGDAITLLGGVCITRHYRNDDEEATLKQIQLFNCNVLVLAERSGLRKSGRTIEDLLKWDAEFFAHSGIKWWIGSSSTFTARARENARDQGVLAVTNLYGSSEFGIFSVSCCAHPEQFHLLLGHVFVEVVDDNGLPVRSGQRGRILGSFISSSRPGAGLAPHEGTQLLRFENGDRATYFEGTCDCGLQSPRITDLARS
jgi:phenylacetate-coenzyme A ligase PaaK-like adenylate-forming protein